MHIHTHTYTWRPATFLSISVHGGSADNVGHCEIDLCKVRVACPETLAKFSTEVQFWMGWLSHRNLQIGSYTEARLWHRILWLSCTKPQALHFLNIFTFQRLPPHFSCAFSLGTDEHSNVCKVLALCPASYLHPLFLVTLTTSSLNTWEYPSRKSISWVNVDSYSTKSTRLKNNEAMGNIGIIGQFVTI